MKNTSAVTINVGLGGFQESWIVQKKLLTAHSTFLKASLAHSWDKKLSNAIDLPEDKPAIFKTFVQYLYLGRIFGAHTPEEAAKMWILGVKLGCPDYTDQALRHLILIHRNNYSNCTPELVKLIFCNSSTASDLQNFAILQFLAESRAGEHREEVTEWTLLSEEFPDFNHHLVAKTLTGSAEPLVALYKSVPRVDDNDYLQQWLTTIKQQDVPKHSSVSPGIRRNRGNGYSRKTIC